ncbi:MAG: bifunctional hydroxymethylpyrimidine kinase/phosphomethylpyrimidine kinase [Chthoniobacterales bacterium]|nr:bifunctional hydroxymethylpyrimidine kinase/phosphomethylpyrimidine kinase [Chthoniobacterales bacterium]
MSKRAPAPPVALTIAGSDNSCGAGIQADLKTFTAFGVYGLTAVTCVVAEVPGRVEHVQAVKPGVLRSQIRMLFDAYPVVAVKTGMLYSRPLLRVVSEELADRIGRFHLVVDPVMVASSGDPLLKPDAVRAYEHELFPLADVITPNLDEAAVLLGRKIRTRHAMDAAARELHGKYRAAVLLKGGHLRGSRAVDVLCDRKEIQEFVLPFIPRRETHGSGCTLSSAVTAGLARGRSLRVAVGDAKKFLHRAIERQLAWQRGNIRTAALRLA